MDDPSPEPMAQDMGSSVPGEDPFGDDTIDQIETNDSEGGEKPFDDTPFDAGVEADEQSDPAKYIQQLSGKLGQSLRSHAKSNGGEPDFDLEKFAINSVISATHTAEMDREDQTDIINKIKSSGDDGQEGNLGDEPIDSELDMGDSEGGEPDIDLSDIEMEESVMAKKTMNTDLLDKKVSVSHRKELGIIKDYDGEYLTIEYPDLGFTEKVNPKMVEVKYLDGQFTEDFNPNGNGRTVFQDLTLGVKDGGMEENKYLNLENEQKSGIFANKIKSMLRESFMNVDAPTTLPTTKPVVKPTKKPSRKSKPWTVTPKKSPDPRPKMTENEEGGENEEILYISHNEPTNKSVTIKFKVGRENPQIVKFINTEELLNSDEVKVDRKASWHYLYNSVDGMYSTVVSFDSDIYYGGNFISFGDNSEPTIEKA